MRRPYRPATSGDLKTWVEIGDDELAVVAYWESSPAEPDVNWGGDFEITGVTYNDIEIIERLTSAELDDLSMRVQEQLNDYDDGDYLYEQEKDRRLGRE